MIAARVAGSAGEGAAAADDLAVRRGVRLAVPGAGYHLLVAAGGEAARACRVVAVLRGDIYAVGIAVPAGSGQQVLDDLNLSDQALATEHEGTSAPSETQPFMRWRNDTDKLLYRRPWSGTPKVW